MRISDPSRRPHDGRLSEALRPGVSASEAGVSTSVYAIRHFQRPLNVVYPATCVGRPWQIGAPRCLWLCWAIPADTSPGRCYSGRHHSVISMMPQGLRWVFVSNLQVAGPSPASTLVLRTTALEGRKRCPVSSSEVPCNSERISLDPQPNYLDLWSWCLS